MDKSGSSTLRQAVISLSCHLWMLAQNLKRASSIQDALTKTLGIIEERLEKLSLLMLAHSREASIVITRGTSIDRRNFLEHIKSIYLISNPFLAVSLVLNFSVGSGGTRRKSHPSNLVARLLHPPCELEIDLFDGKIRDILNDSILDCETIWMHAMSPSETGTGSELEPFMQKFNTAKETEYIVNFQNCNSKKVKLHCRTDKIVLINNWEACINREYGNGITVPDITQLRLQDPETDEVLQIAFGRFNLYDLHRIVRIILHSARMKQIFRMSLKAFESPPGLFLLYDKLRISINGKRPKIRDIELYEKSLKISRRKGVYQIILLTVKTSGLLHIGFRPSHQTRGIATLAMFWKMNEKDAAINYAEIYFENLDVLWIWAAFLTANLSTSKKKGRFDVSAMPSDLLVGDRDIENLMVLESRHILESILLIARGDLDPYNLDIMSSYLVEFSRRLADRRSPTPAKDEDKQENPNTVEDEETV